MNLILQWIVVSVILAAAVLYLVARLSGRGSAGNACGACTGCPAAAKMAALVSALDHQDTPGNPD